MGLTIALYQFFFNRSIWNDEATLSLNIIHRSPAGLLKPLDYAQVAPILFLEIQHFSFYFISHSEFGLRLFPLLAYFASIYFLYQILTHFVKNRITIALALALFVFNSIIIYYSSEVKQYMTDVFTGLLVYFFLLKDYKSKTNRFIILGCIGVLSVFLSNISPILLCTIFVFLILTLPKKEIVHDMPIVFVPWAVCFALYYCFFISNHPTRTYMIGYWTVSNGFMPLNPLSAVFYRFLIIKLEMIFYFLFGYGYAGKIFLPLLLILGLFSLYKSQKKAHILLIILPTIVQLILSALKLYPFEKRLILYQYPILIIGIAVGVDFLFNLSKKRFSLKSTLINNMSAVLLSIYLVVFVYFNGFPMLHTEIKESLKYIEQRSKDDETIYVYKELVPSFWFYRDINYSKFKNRIFYGAYGQDLNDNINQLKKSNGKVWLLLSNEGTNGAQFIINKLDHANCRKLDSFQYGEASACLYDLSTLKD